MESERANRSSAGLNTNNQASSSVNFFFPQKETVCPADWLCQSKVQLFWEQRAAKRDEHNQMSRDIC